MKRLIVPTLAWLWLVLATAAQAETFRTLQLLDSEIEYRATEGRSVVVGRAPAAELELGFDDSDLRHTVLTITVDPRRFRSGNIFRDSDVPNRVFEVDRFPLIRFEVDRIEAEMFDLPAGATRNVTIVGTLSMHGVERAVRVPVEVVREGTVITASGGLEVLLSDYGMKRPRFLFVAVGDAIEVAFRIVVEVARE